jgi:hypothetical protein
MATLLLAIGAFILIKYAVRPPRVATARTSPHRRRFLAPLGFVGGFVDATGGGGWGPVSTASLLTAGRTAPRTVIGSVSASEFLVTVAASAGFVLGLGTAGIDWLAVAGLVGGGVVAAPLAAWLVTRLPAPVLGAAVGAFTVLTNLATVLAGAGVEGVAVPTAHIAVAAVGVLALALAFGPAGVAGWVLLVAVPAGLLVGALTLLGRGGAVRRSGQAALVWWALVTGLLVVTGLAAGWERAAAGATVVGALGLGLLGVVLLVGSSTLRAIAAQPAPVRPAACAGCACGAGGCGIPR